MTTVVANTQVTTTNSGAWTLGATGGQPYAFGFAAPTSVGCGSTFGTSFHRPHMSHSAFPSQIKHNTYTHHTHSDPLSLGRVSGHVPAEMRVPEPYGVGMSKSLRLGDLTHFPTFSGQVLTQIPQEFLKGLEENFELMRLSEADRLMVASRRLTGRALGWFSQVKSQINSYSDFVRMFY